MLFNELSSTFWAKIKFIRFIFTSRTYFSFWFFLATIWAESKFIIISFVTIWAFHNINLLFCIGLDLEEELSLEST